eukprot:6444933-Pyramimonas_sp.AAC.1
MCIRDRLSPAAMPLGMVFGNDIDNRFLPSVRTRKMATPATVLTIGNASKWPPQFEPTDAADISPYEPAVKQFLYDRIICDVPCSGDGTIRKNPSIWRSWQKGFTYALKLHTQQLKILMRGLHHLKPGGYLTYSTCSMNPIENEAVVLAAVARFGASIELCPIPSKFGTSAVPSSPGLTTWQQHGKPHAAPNETRNGGNTRLFAILNTVLPFRRKPWYHTRGESLITSATREPIFSRRTNQTQEVR